MTQTPGPPFSPGSVARAWEDRGIPGQGWSPSWGLSLPSFPPDQAKSKKSASDHDQDPGFRDTGNDQVALAGVVFWCAGALLCGLNDSAGEGQSQTQRKQAPEG